MHVTCSSCGLTEGGLQSAPDACSFCQRPLPAAFCCDQPEGIDFDLTIVDALAIPSHPTWNEDQPPCDITGDPDADLELADIFRDLTSMDHAGDRLRWIETRLRSLDRADHFPSPNAPANACRTVLIRWWLAIYDAHQGVAA